MSEYKENCNEDDAVDHSVIKEECLKLFGSKDFIMESNIYSTLKRYFQHSGDPEPVVQLLSENYTATAQMSNIIAEWLILLGLENIEVQKIVESHLENRIIKIFDPKKADSIFTQQKEIPTWLPNMISYPTWRSLIYKLTEKYNDCLFLNFAIKLISDAGFQSEIKSVSTAAQQIEIFSKIFKSSLINLLYSDENKIEGLLLDFKKLVCYGEHTYLYSTTLLNYLKQNITSCSFLKRLHQEIQEYAKEKNKSVASIDIALTNAYKHVKVQQALSSMMTKNALNPADITILYKMYNVASPPPIGLIRTAWLMNLLIESLFKSSCVINPDHKSKYIYLLAHCCCANDSDQKPESTELNDVIEALNITESICSSNYGFNELIPEIAHLFHCMRFAVVSACIIVWVENTVADPKYFSSLTDFTTPIHIAILDEVTNHHCLFHPILLNFYEKLFSINIPDLDVMFELELKKMVLERMIHLISRGYVLPVLSFITKLWRNQETDISLIRYFVSELLDIISPPYSSELVKLLLPLVKNDDITLPLRNETANDSVVKFIKDTHGTDELE